MNRVFRRGLIGKLKLHWWLLALAFLCLKAGNVGYSLNTLVISKGGYNTLYGWDTSFYFFWLRSAVFDFDADFSNDIELSNTLPDEDKQFALEGLLRTEKDLVPNKYPIGWAIFHMPWFVAGHGVALASETAGYDVRTDGYGKVYEAFLYAGSLFYAALGLWLTYLLLRLFFEWRIASASVALVWMSGFLIFYQTRQYGMAHNLTYLCTVSAFYWALQIRSFPESRSKWMLLGLSAGMLIITRYQASLYLLYPFCLVVSEIWMRRASVVPVALGSVAFAVPVLAQLGCWKMLYGQWIVYTYEGEGFLWAQPELLKSLFNPNHGLFYWHPIFLIGLIGLVLFVASRERFAWLWLVSSLAVFYLNAAWHCWWFGVSFGNRAYEGMTLFVFMGIAWLLKSVQAKSLALRGSLYTLLLGLALWNIGVLEVAIYSWESGIGLDGAESYSDLFEAVWARFFSAGS